MITNNLMKRTVLYILLFVIAGFYIIKVLLQADIGKSGNAEDHNIEFHKSESLRETTVEYKLNAQQPLIPISGNLTEKNEVTRLDIPHETLKNSIINNISEKHRNIGFLENMPTYREMIQMGVMREQSVFGDINNMNCSATYCYLNGRILNREMITENPEDMFKFLPAEEEFLKEFKNPCWKGKALDRETLYCLPYFFIAGFTKSGTTDLHQILGKHPLISSHGDKEEHYFDRQRRGRSIKMHRRPFDKPKSLMSYVYGGQIIAKRLMRTYKEIEGTDVLYHGITMDATPSYVWDNEFWEKFYPGYKEPPVTNADTISKLNPKTKIILSLRDPISRMRSAYQFFCQRQVYDCDRPITPEKYHNLVVEAVEMFNTCLKNNTVRGCTYSTETHQLATHLYASMYHVYIADYMEVFPRDQVYVLQMEERSRDPIASINNLCDFLEIPPFAGDTLRSFLEVHDTGNQILDEHKLPYVLPETTELLEEFFKPYLRDLVGLLGHEKWYWNRPS
ncbi:carbohydrate sulfotransferase 15-like [Bolinopsis microptera]|uniref:carbohydrate sulfotransferase 15-like n=1 Tax=Bolinopsis microptera TaxID=2820187 RepID=UPI0030792ECC